MSDKDDAIAIIGMAGRFPGASDVDAFWRNIRDGIESIGLMSDEELLANGVEPELLQNPNYVKIRPYLDDIRGFDAGFFGYSPREAKVADPQQRIFLECAWEALEYAGYGAPERRGRVGVFGGANLSMYGIDRFGCINQGRFDFSPHEVVIGNDKDALTTMVSYKLNLNGPSMAVQTFCSSSLSAVHVACVSLRHGECDMALAGGVSIRVPDKLGYLYQEGGMESPDGHVRTFDADARGGNFGDGAAVVLLKPLRQAIADRDTVLAAIRGSAMTNDGALRFSYTAPSVVGQAEAVAAAMADAGVTPEQISYVEAHGTATELGDPIEVAALTRAYGPVRRKQYCLIGSVKTNVGHLDRAAGTTGLIKIVQSLRHELIPATLHYRSPNPEIDFVNSPFRVCAQPTPWPRDERRPRIAGLNSLGMGGTNVHVVVEEAPQPAARDDNPRRWQIIPISARSETAVGQYCSRLAGHLADAGDIELADVAFTMQVGRQVFEHRRVAIVDSVAAAAAALDSAGGRLLARVDATNGRGTAFLFSGVGEHYRGMVAELYRQEPVFRGHLDQCQEILAEQVPELRTLLTTPAGADQGEPPDLAELLGRTQAKRPLAAIHRTEIAQPAVFVAEYALARTLMDWGITPSIMIGYSVGEYVAACLAGVLSLADALRLVTRRAELIAALPGGSMLAVGLTAAQLRDRVPDLDRRGLDLAADNGAQVVLAGPADAAAELADLLREQGVACRDLDTTHAFHSRMLAPAVAELTSWVAQNVSLHPPQLPYVSNVTGELATADLVTDPGYWAAHMCGTVRFADGLATVLSQPDLSFVEIGPGRSLGAMLRSHPDCGIDRWPLVVATLPAETEDAMDDATVAEAIGRLWLTGVTVDWFAYHGVTATRAGTEHDWVPGRIPLPTYPFQRQSFWWNESQPAHVHHSQASGSQAGADGELPRLPENRFIHLPVWRQTAPRPAVAATEPQQWLVFTDAGAADAVTAELAARLHAAGHGLTIVRPGQGFQAEPSQPGSDQPAGYRVRPGSPEDMLALFGALRAEQRRPDRIVHLWTLDPGRDAMGPDPVAEVTRRGLHTLVAVARAAQEIGLTTWSLEIVTSGTHRVTGTETVYPERTGVLGPCRMIPVECPGVVTRLIDVPADRPAPLPAVLAEMFTAATDQIVALRDGRRWVPGYDVLETTADPSMTNMDAPIRRGGVYLITGGLGGIGLAMAERLAEHYEARLVLFGRTPVPPREQWEAILGDPTATEEVRRRLESLRRLETKGAEVVLVAGDVADPADARRAVTTALDRFGALHGVLHCAGVPGMGLMVLKTNADMDRVLAPKVAGTLALAGALRDVPVDFLALFSSVGSATGAVGQTDYCSANAFLDACAHSDLLPHSRVVSIGWGEWTWNGWTAGLAGYDPVVREYFQEHRRRFGITFDEGWRSLLRVLASGQPHVFVSTQDFNAVVAGSRNFTVDEIKAAAQRERGGQDRHPRPELSTQYEAPQTHAEKVIAEIWAEALGVDRVGIQDNFFELGGNSLVGVGIVDNVRRALKLDHLPAHIIYQAPTVGALAAQATGATAEHTRDTAGRALQQRTRIQRRRDTLRSGRPA